MTTRRLRASDLARRVTMVAGVLDEAGLTGTIEADPWDGRVSVAIGDAEDRQALAARLGLDRLRLMRVGHYAASPIAFSEGEWCDIPVRLTSLADRDEAARGAA